MCPVGRKFARSVGRSVWAATNSWVSGSSMCRRDRGQGPPPPPRIPSWVIRLSDSGGLETNLEFAPRPPRAIGSESKGFGGSQKRACGLRGGSCSASLDPLEGGGRFGWAVDASLNAEKTIAARKCHLGILSEYGPFSVNTPIWRLQNLRLVSEYDGPRSPCIILIKEMEAQTAGIPWTRVTWPTRDPRLTHRQLVF